MIKKILSYCLICSFLLPFQQVYAIDETGFLIEAIDESENITQIDQVSTWEEAQTIYTDYEDMYQNVYIKKDEAILKIKYGFIAFHKSDACDVNINYTQGNENGYTNGCYGVDAPYLSTSEDGRQVSFLLSGAYGTASIEDVDIYPMKNDLRLSSYLVREGKLYHQIKTDMSHDLYSNSIYLGEAPEYLKEDTTYYSFDGHYFYLGDTLQGYYSMVDDLRASSYANALNAQTPYYNYYQYISHRTKTAYNEDQINAYFDDTLHIQSPLTSYKSIGTSYHAILTQSMLKAQANAFLQYQDQFGANALMMLALSMNESATGRSYLAYTRNNVFGHAAFDSAVEENASRYSSISSSIYSHAKHYISNSYLNPEQFQYHGGYFGSKASGMNVSYASDPYWGEKAAQYYARLDDALGGKDKDAYALGILSSNQVVSIYKEATRSSDVLYTNNNLKDVAVVLLEKQGNWYKIQSDPAANEDGRYVFSQDIGFVSADDIEHILHEEKMKLKTTSNITFDANNGLFQGEETSITLQIDEGQIPAITPPQKENALFIGWDKELSPVTSDATYTAQYKEVKQVEIANLEKNDYYSDEQLDVSGATLKITYQDDEIAEIPLDTSMISNFDTQAIGDVTLQIHYQGISTTTTITMQPVKEEEQTDFINYIENKLDSLQTIEDMSTEQKLEFTALKQELDAQKNMELSYGSYRKLDAAIQKAYGFSLQILISGDMQAQVSGLSIATKLAKPAFFPTVLKFNVSTGLSKSSQTMLENIALANDYTPEAYFELTGKHDFSDLQLNDDIIVSLKKPENTQANMQYLIMQYKDNNVYQIPTSQSNNYITFSTDSLGEYALLSRTTSNIYGDNDISENNMKENNGWDVFTLLTIGAFLILLLIIILISILVRRKRKFKHHSGDKKKGKPQPPLQESSFLSSHNIQADQSYHNNIEVDDEQ